ncbi:hypothetical protein PYW08_005680 [Mythimna loreyi]|uniref:CSP15 n=2 Tax=Mythimna loreyi TaxID=667449 RepID=A0AAU6NDG8_9NEOP|nr:hypothetical protein PYW08_005680 [Mythimna loreyi]
MNYLVLSLVVTLAAFVAADLSYTDKYDHVNVDEILDNRKLLVPYIKCTLDQGRCTPDGRELKAHIKDAMQTGCAKCTKKQKKAAKKVVKHIRSKEQDYWKQIVNKYDPGNEYTETYEAFLASPDESK